jgi:CheY-like chemotaxis protein
MKNILIADDCPWEYEELMKSLEAVGYQITTARNGSEAEERLRELGHDGIDAFVLDNNMGERRDWGDCTAFRLREKHYYMGPIVIRTSLGPDELPDDVQVFSKPNPYNQNADDKLVKYLNEILK